MRRPFLLALILLAACAPAPSAPPAPPPPAPGEVQVDLLDFAFQPSTLRVAPETVVVFRNRGQAHHTATDEGGRFDSGLLAPGEEFRYAFKTPGTYRIFCRLHPYMVLSLEVGP
ncbi:cupredoxin domain-containing protein [Thermus oshimai]|uniref:cupredoxin domain-containing protein n=1 Tax=Thermus oshimai TaxID=56957 RepID=UPI00036A42EF|nr:cupredoxin domain-containing protein [Thermus oshimai]